MLPDFTSVKDVMNKLSQLLMKHQVNNTSPILSQGKHIHYFEGNCMKVIDENGREEISDFKKLSVERTIESKDVIEGGYNFVAEVNDGMAKEMQQKQESLLFQAIDEAAKKHGNEVDAGGKELNPELILELFGKLDYTFDEYGNSTNDFTFIVNSAVYEKFKIKLEAIEQDPQYNEKYNALMELKKMEFYDRESNRKLVD